MRAQQLVRRRVQPQARRLGLRTMDLVQQQQAEAHELVRQRLVRLHLGAQLHLAGLARLRWGQLHLDELAHLQQERLRLDGLAHQ